MGGNATAGTQFYIAHLWGTPYEMGFAHGTLLRDEIIDFMTKLWVHLEEEFDDGPDWLPPSVRDWIIKLGLEAAMQFTADATDEYTPEYWFEELHGLADAVNSSDVPYEDILHLCMFGELTKGTCSMFGAWGDAVIQTDSSLLQLRALDWDNTGPFPQYPAVVVYHPRDGHPFANVGWVGWIGSITGMSSQQMAISEIGVYFPDETWGEETRFGYPFTYVLRDILQFDNSIDDSINRLANTDRTCNLLFGVSDGKADKVKFRGFQYDSTVMKVFDDQNLLPNATWHPRIQDVVYWGMDWNCPGFNSVLYQQLTKFYGNITVENTIRHILPTMQTGDTHAVIYDLTNNFMYYASCGPENTPRRDAYDRPFTKIDMAKLFKEPKPTKTH